MNIFKKWNMGYTKTLAESGDRESAYKMGNYYYEGKIVKQDFVEAVKWFADASRWGFRRVDAERNGGLRVAGPHPQAAEILARCYRDGIGVNKNIFYAILLFATAIGSAADRMKGKEKDILQASAQKQGGELLKQLLEESDSLSAMMQYHVGYACYYYGSRLLSNIMPNENFTGRAMSLLTKAYQNGYADAAHQIAHHIRYGEKNPIKALEWLKNGAERGGLISQYELGEIYSSGEEEMKIAKNKDIAVDWYLKVCEHRDANLFNINYVRKAMGEIGHYYRREKKDYLKAIQYYKQAIASPDPSNPFDYVDDTVVWLGYAYRDIGNKEEAKKMFTIGAKYYGDEFAMEALGMNREQIRLEMSGMR